MATQRLRRELNSLQVYGCRCTKEIEPKGDDLFRWRAILIGPKHTPYDGGLFELEIEIPAQYPFRPPRVLFKTSIYHPSINRQSGTLCDQILSDGWKPSRDIDWVLNTIYEILEKPSSTSPVEPEIACEFERNPALFIKNARDWTKRYARRM